MTAPSLPEIYRAYVDCLNRQDWARLGEFVDDGVEHNGRPLGLSGYRDMLVGNFDDIPDLRFDVRLLVSDPPRVAVRLDFRCSPKAVLLGLDVDGRTVSFSEHAFYGFEGAKIARVWSVIDRAAIEAQLRP